MILSSWSSRGFEVNWGTIALVGSPEQTPRVARGRENAARRSPWTLKWSRPKNSKKCGRVVQKYGCREKGILRYWVADSWHPYVFDDLVLFGLHFAAKMTPRYAKMTVDGAKLRQKDVKCLQNIDAKISVHFNTFFFIRKTSEKGVKISRKSIKNLTKNWCQTELDAKSAICNPTEKTHMMHHFSLTSRS